MSTDVHKVLKQLSSYDVKKILSNHMKSLGYKALCGSGGDIHIRFIRLSENASIDDVEFEVQDVNNPEPESVWINKSEAIEIIARAKKIDLKTHCIKID